MNNVKEELKRLVDLKGEDNWSSSTRNTDLYELVERQYSFGKRKTFRPKNNSDYVNLQSSRSLSVELHDEYEAFYERAKNGLNLKPNDLERIQEVERFVPSLKSVVELGFRLPVLLEFYESNYGSKTAGFDVVPISIMVGKEMGYDVNLYDLSLCEGELDLKDANLVVCYHVLEHITDPLVPIKKIFDSMSPECYFHVEVPIEPGTPQLQFAHLFPFESGDLGHMLEKAGFKVIHKTESRLGSLAERYMAIKE